MRGITLAVVFLTLTSTAYADGYGPRIAWKGWLVQASWPPMGPQRDRVEHPLTYLVDGDPNTSWMLRGNPWLKSEGNPPSIELLRSHEPGQPWSKANPVAVDELWLMNGFSKSRELFLRNNRAVEVKLRVNRKLVKTVALSDKMGWHRITIPTGGHGAWSVKVEITRQAKGKDNDLCLSELALYNKGRKVDLGMPPYVLFSGGSECGCGGPGYRFMSRTGWLGTSLSLGEIAEPAWSPGGRFVACMSTESGEHLNRFHIRAWDTHTGRAIYRREVKFDEDHDRDWQVIWQGDRTLRAVLQADGKSQTTPKRLSLKVR